MQLLLSAGKPEVGNDNGWLLSIVPSLAGNIDVVRLLLRHNAGINSKEQEKVDAVALCIQRWTLESSSSSS